VIEMEVRQQQIDVADAVEAGRVAYQAPGTRPKIEKQRPLSVADQETRRLSRRRRRGTATAKELEAHARRLIAGDWRPPREQWRPPPARKPSRSALPPPPNPSGRRADSPSLAVETARNKDAQEREEKVWSEEGLAASSSACPKANYGRDASRASRATNVGPPRTPDLA
jgi:hypothetical protein